MAYADYIHCRLCDCKLIYDGYADIRDRLQSLFNIAEEDRIHCELICPDCIRSMGIDAILGKGVMSAAMADDS